MKRKAKRIFIVLIAAALLLAAAVFVPNCIVVNKAKSNIITSEEAAQISDTDCAVILGAGIRDGKPTPMLRDRLLTGIELYKSGAAKKLIMSGDHGSEDYDEVNTMKSYAVENGIPDSDIFMDHAGFSTYESMDRARKIFQVKRFLIVTQQYHLYRAVYMARRLGIDAEGIAAKQMRYNGQMMREVREILARSKDFLNVIVQPESVGGSVISLDGSGDVTNDQ